MYLPDVDDENNKVKLYIYIYIHTYTYTYKLIKNYIKYVACDFSLLQLLFFNCLYMLSRVPAILNVQIRNRIYNYINVTNNQRC